jgi:rSAM/selenodomain-associated transferase 2
MPSFSIIIPVLNEPLIINQTVEHVYLTGSGFKVEVIVVDGDPGGATINSIQKNDVIKVLSSKGRGIQMNKGASAATSEILLFLHTDTELPAGAFSAILDAVDKKQCAGGAFDLGIKSERVAFRLIEKMANIRSHFTGIPYGDQAIFVKKKIFDELNGFKEIPLMEDLEFMMRMKKAGHKICIMPQKVKTSPRRWEKEGVFYCTFRNWILRGLYHLGVRPDKLVKFYYSDWEP